MSVKSISTKVAIASGKALGRVAAMIVETVLFLVVLVIAAVVILHLMAASEDRLAPKVNHCPPVVAELSDRENKLHAGGV